MIQSAQIRQLRDLRKVKVDRLSTEVGLARKKLVGAKETFEDASDEYEKMLADGGMDFDSVLDQAANLHDPQTRLVAVNRTMTRKRAAEARARARRDAAEAEISQTESRLEQLMHDLAVAQAQLKAAETIAERTQRAENTAQEQQSEDNLLDQFSSGAGSGQG